MRGDTTTEKYNILKGRFGAGGWGTAGRSRVSFPMVSLEFFNYLILPATLWTWSRLKRSTETNIGNISWGKGGRWVGLTNLHFHVSVLLRSRSLKLKRSKKNCLTLENGTDMLSRNVGK